MIRPALILALALLTLAGLWALASKPAAAYLLGGLDDEPETAKGRQQARGQG